MRRWVTLGLVAFAVLIADQATKWWAVANLTRAFQRPEVETLADRLQLFLTAEDLGRGRKKPMHVWPEHLHFRYVENPGAAWGMLGGARDWVRLPIFFVTSAIAVGFILYFYRRLPARPGVVPGALALVLGGALGNFVDRVSRGHVIDFIDVHWKNHPRLHWPTFNVADIAICVGVCVLLADILFRARPEESESQPLTPPVNVPQEP